MHAPRWRPLASAVFNGPGGDRQRGSDVIAPIASWAREVPCSAAMAAQKAPLVVGAGKRGGWPPTPPCEAGGGPQRRGHPVPSSPLTGPHTNCPSLPEETHGRQTHLAAPPHHPLSTPVDDDPTFPTLHVHSCLVLHPCVKPGRIDPSPAHTPTPHPLTAPPAGGGRRCGLGPEPGDGGVGVGRP